MKQRLGLCCSRTESFNSFLQLPINRGVVAHWLIRCLWTEGRGFEFHSIASTPGTFGKSFANSIYSIYYYYILYILYTVACSASSCKLRHCQLLWSGAPLCSSGLKEALYKYPD